MSGKASPNSDDLFAGRGSPALMSRKEAGIRLLNERYLESFAIVAGTNRLQIHLFLVKAGMWALVWTFSPKDLTPVDEHSELVFGVRQVLSKIEEAMQGKDQLFLEKLNKAVDSAIARVRLRTRK